MKMLKQPFAYTALDLVYPEFVNFTEDDNGDLIITVRGPKKLPTQERPFDMPGDTVAMRLPASARPALKAIL